MRENNDIEVFIDGINIKNLEIPDKIKYVWLELKMDNSNIFNEIGDKNEYSKKIN